MIPENDVMVLHKREVKPKKHRRIPAHCSICTGFIWFAPIALREPPGAPEPRRSWILCKSCHEALLVEMRRSPVHSPLRLRIAMGLVAAERSPSAYNISSHVRDQRAFTWIMWLLFLFGLLHVALFVILFAAAR